MRQQLALTHQLTLTSYDQPTVGRRRMTKRQRRRRAQEEGSGPANSQWAASPFSSLPQLARPNPRVYQDRPSPTSSSQFPAADIHRLKGGLLDLFTTMADTLKALFGDVPDHYGKQYPDELFRGV